MEAAEILQTGRSLTELHAVGPSIAKRLQSWIETPPARKRPPDLLRRDFLTLAEAQKIFARDRSWPQRLRGDLQMHTQWSDGSGTVGAMAAAVDARGYEYIAITDHTKGLKIAGGIDEAEVAKQAAEIDATNVRTNNRVSQS